MAKERAQLQIRALILRPHADQVKGFKGMPAGFLCDAMGGGVMCSSIHTIGSGLRR